MDRKSSLKGAVLLFLLVFTAFSAYSQNIEITGSVVDENSQGLVGATVIVEGTSIGAATDANGKFRITVPEGTSHLTFASIGYQTQVVPLGGRTTIHISLEPETLNMETVVVTALGITRDQKALGYSAQSVGGSTLSTVASISPLNALSGAIAGMNVTSSGGGAGSSVRILIRGANSLTQTNEPLYVVDGVPIDNTIRQSGDSWGGFDFGNAANNINADDIVNITVLKGGAAAALYGSRGQNGVVMITTKQGEKGEKLAINIKQSLTIDSPMKYPSLQNEYSQGSGSKYVQGSYMSWGERMRGQVITNYLGQQQELIPTKENPFKEFFSTGVTSNTNISISKGTNRGGIFLSGSYLTSDGTNRTNTFDKLNLNLRLVQELTSWLSMDVKANVLSQEGKNRPRMLGSPDNPVHALYHLPRSVTMDQVKHYRTLDNEPVYYSDQYEMIGGSPVPTSPIRYAGAPLVNNPYWSVNLNNNNDKRKRFIGYAKFEIDLLNILNNINLDKFSIMGRVGTDYYDDVYFQKVQEKTLYKNDGMGTINLEKVNRTESNYDFLISVQKSWGKFGMSALGGGSLTDFKSEAIVSSSDQGIIEPSGKYVLNNFNGVKTTQGKSRKQIQSFYGTVTLDYASQVYLDISGRNDWSSSLSPDNWSFFYPSVSGSWIISETFPQLRNTFSLLKLRASYAQVGNSPIEHKLRYLYVPLPGEYMGKPYGSLGITSRPNFDMVAEKTVTSEVGISATLFTGRLNVDLAYYEAGTKNQIFDAPVAPSTGFSTALINSGLVKNTGIEISVDGSILRGKNYDWNLYGNFSWNKAKVKELKEFVDVLRLGGFDKTAFIQARLHQSSSRLEGVAFDRDANGNILLDNKNLPMKKLTEMGAESTTEYLGNSMPKYVGGFGTKLQWKNLFADVFMDFKAGHKLYSYSNAMGNANGLLKGTEAGRDEWGIATDMAAQIGGGYDPRNIGGLQVTGSKDGVVGSYYANPQEYYQRLSEIHEAYIYNASYIRFQRLAVGYNFSGASLAKAGISSIGVSVVGSNLFYLYKKTPNITPNMTTSFSSYGGIEYYAYPELRSMGMSVSISF